MKKIFTILGIVSVATFANAQIVINEVYGGGGNSGSTYKNDFVELINRGSSSVTLTGATLQYASSAGTFNQYHPLPSITLSPGQTYLIQEQAGAGGSVDLVPDYVAPIPTNFGSGTNTVAGFAMAAANGKIALVSNDSQISSPTDSNVLDFVGYGTANQFEGSGAAPAISATLSASRTNGADTNDNAVDFTTGAPSPKNSSQLAVSDVTKGKLVLVKNTIVDNTLVFAATADVKIYNINGQLVKSSSVKENSSLDISALPKGVYIVNGNGASQKIIKK